MKVELRQQPRIVVDVIAEIEGFEFDLIDLHCTLDALEHGDVHLDEDTTRQLKRMKVVTCYSDEGRTISSAGKRFGELLKAVRRAAADSNIELPVSRD